MLDTAHPVGAVHISGLNKSYGEIKAVQNLSLDIRKGEIFALLGPNGAGKTTIIEILEGYRTRDSGSVSVIGLDPQKRTDLAQLKECIGVMLQQSSIYEKIRVGEAINLFASYYEVPPIPSSYSGWSVCKIMHDRFSRTFRVGRNSAWGLPSRS